MAGTKDYRIDGDAKRSKRMMVRVSEEEKATFERAAKAGGLSLGEWVRAACQRALDRDTTPELEAPGLRHAEDDLSLGELVRELDGSDEA